MWILVLCQCLCFPVLSFSQVSFSSSTCWTESTDFVCFLLFNSFGLVVSEKDDLFGVRFYLRTAKYCSLCCDSFTFLSLTVEPFYHSAMICSKLSCGFCSWGLVVLLVLDREI